MEEEEVYESPAMRWHWSMVLVRVLVFFASLFGVTGRMFAGVAEDVTSHINYQAEQDEFVAEAGRELEMLVEGPEEGTD